MAIKDKDIGFGESTVVIKPSCRSTRHKTEIVCDHCGDNRVEVSFYCRWNVTTQMWVCTGELNDNVDPFCPTCEDVCSFEEMIILIPGAA